MKKQEKYVVELTAREYQIVQQLLIAGASNQQIADELNISLLTVKTHLRSIYQKSGTKNCREFLVWLMSNEVRQEISEKLQKKAA